LSTRYRSTLLIFLILGLALNFIPVYGLPDEVTLYPTNDAYVSSVDPNNKYGEIDELYASNRTPFGGIIRNSYLLFNLSSLPSDAIIQSANLNLYTVYIGSKIKVNAHYCADTNWNESIITYNNAPQFEKNPISSVNITNIGENIFFDVTSTVLDAWDNNKTISFVITSEERTSTADYAKFRSKEHEGLFDSRPKLIIEYQFETPITPFEIILNTSPAFTGTITFNGNSYSHGSTITKQSNTYDINANPAINYTFSKWETEGNITVSNSNSASTKCTVSGNGTLRMVQTESPSQSAHINFETDPTNAGEIGFDGSSYRNGSKTVRSTGSYTISANPDSGYNFSRWETSGSIMVSNTNSVSTACDINGNGTIKMVLISSTPTSPSVCVIITALHGSALNSEVDYMRHVRDDMIGSNEIGENIVLGWNTFYYSWSPQLAKWIGGSTYVKSIFRVLLMPLIAIVHSVSIIYVMIASFNNVLASVFSFAFASVLTSIVYVALPIMIVLAIVRRIYSNRNK
jgi:hypothetical protein